MKKLLIATVVIGLLTITPIAHQADNMMLFRASDKIDTAT